MLFLLGRTSSCPKQRLLHVPGVGCCSCGARDSSAPTARPHLALPPGRSGGPAPRARSPRGVLGLFVFFFRKPRSEASLPPGMYISYCTVWEGHDLARCRRFPGINPSSPFPSCNLLRMAPRAHAERHTAARTHTRSAARERSGAPDGAVIGRAARGEGDVSSRSHDFSSVWNHL